MSDPKQNDWPMRWKFNFLRCMAWDYLGLGVWIDLAIPAVSLHILWWTIEFGWLTDWRKMFEEHRRLGAEQEEKDHAPA